MAFTAKKDQFLKIFGRKYDELLFFMLTVCEQYSLNIIKINQKIESKKNIHNLSNCGIKVFDSSN